MQTPQFWTQVTRALLRRANWLSPQDLVGALGKCADQMRSALQESRAGTGDESLTRFREKLTGSVTQEDADAQITLSETRAEESDAGPAPGDLPDE